MTEREIFKKTFSSLRASDDTRKEVFYMMNQNRKPRLYGKRLITIAATIAILSTLGIVASATGVLDALVAKLKPVEEAPPEIVGAVGDGIDSEKPDLRDNNGRPLDLPGMDSEKTDPETVMRLAGDYLSDMDAEVEIWGNTVTFHSFMMDENGMGMVSFTVANPKGIGYRENGYGEIELDSMGRLYFTTAAPKGMEEAEYMTSKMILQSGEQGDTSVEMVAYFAAFQEYKAGTPVYVSIAGGDEKAAVVEITPDRYAPAKTLSDSEGHTLSVSALGICVNWHGGHDGCTTDHREDPEEWLTVGDSRMLVDRSGRELVTEAVVIHYADGTDFVVEDENTMNYRLGYYQSGTHTYESVCYAFNRLADIESITSVTVQGRSWDEEENQMEISRTYEP